MVWSYFQFEIQSKTKLVLLTSLSVKLVFKWSFTAVILNVRFHLEPTAVVFLSLLILIIFIVYNLNCISSMWLRLDILFWFCFPECSFGMWVCMHTALANSSHNPQSLYWLTVYPNWGSNQTTTSRLEAPPCINWIMQDHKSSIRTIWGISSQTAKYN